VTSLSDGSLVGAEDVSLSNGSSLQRVAFLSPAGGSFLSFVAQYPFRKSNSSFGGLQCLPGFPIVVPMTSSAMVDPLLNATFEVPEKFPQIQRLH